MTRPAPAVTVQNDWSEYQDEISDAISDSIDMDWSANDGARAVVWWLNENKPLASAPAAPQAAGVGEDKVRRLEAIARGYGSGWIVQDFDHGRMTGDDILELIAALRAPSREPEGGAVDERLKWFLKVIEGAGGEVCSTESRHNPINVFCEDRDNGDDTFNISEAAGYTQTSHDTSFDTSTTRITDKGRAYLAAIATREEAPAEAGEDAGAVVRRWANWIIDESSDMDHDDHDAGKRKIRTERDFILRSLRAQPQAREDAQPVGWLRAVDEEMVCAHLGVADAEDSFETAKNKLASLIQWNIAVATDPSVGGHPAPDALRVAVGALEKIAYGGTYFAAGAMRDAATEALAALQAEQKGGA